MQTSRRRLGQRLLVTHGGLAELSSLSLASLYRRLAAGQVGPVALTLGGRKLFRVSDIRRWVRYGLPDRETFLQLEAERRAKR